jgi:tetratricopeptide (TPR) repeat protein
MRPLRFPALGRPWSRQDWAWAAVLVIGVLASYLPVWRAGFVWDDFVTLLHNTSITDPNGLKAIWSSNAADICPLALTTFYFEHALWGFAPRPYHVVNVVQHAASAVVLWRVLRHLAVPGAWLGAALWAVHPVAVESVAWVVELKNTQSGLFFLLAVLFFLKWLKKEPVPGALPALVLMLVCAFLAMASKSSTVVLPVVLCLCAWWAQGRLEKRVLLWVMPVFFLSAAASAVSLWTQHHALQDGDAYWVRTVPQRVAGAGDAVWFYLGKLVWPHPVITNYARWHIDAGAATAYLPGLAVIVALALFWVKAAGWARPWFMAFTYYVVALLPALGLFDNIIFRYSLVFDHLQYLASMGPLALAGAGLHEVSRWIGPPRARVAAAVVLVLLATLSWQRARTFHSDSTLWTATLLVNPNSWAGDNNLGCDAFYDGRNDEAIVFFQKAIALNPHYPDPYRNLGAALIKEGRVQEAIAAFRETARLSPNDSMAHLDLGKALVDNGAQGEGFAELTQALKLQPNLAEAYSIFATNELKEGQLDAAMENDEKALAINSDIAVAHYDLGLAYSQKGRMGDAIDQYEKSLQVDPTTSEVHNNLGTALGQTGRLDEALAEFEKAVALDAKNFEARRNLGCAYLQKGNTDSAIEQLNAALALTPSDVATHTFLGMAEGQKGNYASAVAQFREVLRLDPENAAAHRYLQIAMAKSMAAPK